MESYQTVCDIMIDEADDLYHSKSKENLSSHALLDYIKSPILYHQKKLGIIPPFDSAAFSLGRAFHTIALEGQEVFDGRYAIGGPINEKTQKPYGVLTNKFKEWAKEQGKPVVSFDDLTKIKNMLLGFKQNRDAVRLVMNGVAESVIRTMIGGFNCQIRMDWFNPAAGLVDLKTTRDMDGFISDAKQFGYLTQLAFYREVIFQATGLVVPVFMIAVEKKAPFRCGVFHVSESDLTDTGCYIRKAMFALRVSLQNNDWPTGYERIQEFKSAKV